MPRRQLRIGELATAVQLRPSALRYYEQVGLLPLTQRIGGQRVYPTSTVRRIALIKMAQQAGFRLAEIRALLGGGDAGNSATRQWRSLAKRKLPEIDAAIDQLRLLRAVVADCLECGCMDFDNCELLKTIGRAEPT
jgi:MerR family redox-sensitive transcriptional activator SoxR